MPRTRIDLQTIVIASPCTVPWDSMSGDAAKRFCGQCRLHVHDFSEMTRDEIDDLLRASDGSCCKRVWRRPDGRVVTKDCDRILRAMRRRLRVVGAFAAGLLAVLGVGGCRGARVADGARNAGDGTSSPVPVAPETPPVPGATVTMGR